MQALGGALAFMVHLKIDGLVAILETTCSYDDLFPDFLKIVHVLGLRIRPLYSDIVIKQEGDYSNVYNAIVICPHFLVAIEHHKLSEEICGVM